MSHPHFDSKLGDETVFDLRADKLAAFAAYAKAETRTDKLREHLDCLEEGIAYLRLIIKYQSFDLEATRRENAELRAMLEVDDDRL